MKTRGIEIANGYLVAPPGRGVQDAFWNRLKHAITKAMLVDEFKADWARQRDAFEVEAEAGWNRLALAIEHEERLFRRWVEKVIGPQEVWPWSRGWTEDLVDSYLQPDSQRRAA